MHLTACSVADTGRKSEACGENASGFEGKNIAKGGGENLGIF
jgi:hypothetical protein